MEILQVIKCSLKVARLLEGIGASFLAREEDFER